MKIHRLRRPYLRSRERLQVDITPGTRDWHSCCSISTNMSRCLTLEEYLQEFVDDNTQSAGEELQLVVTNQQAQTLGFFLINGLAGFVECLKLQRNASHESAGEDENAIDAKTSDGSEPEEFIN